MREQIDKHIKYKEQYKKNELYWGLGIENELYLEFENKLCINKNKLLKNHQRERYSINYYGNYKSEFLNSALKSFVKSINNTLYIPLLINSHSFTKTDKNNNSQKLYTKNSIINPDFNGKTLIEELQESNEYFKKAINNKWLFDGDTIEFITNNFYKSTLIDILNELHENKLEFINNLNHSFEKHNIFTNYGKVKFMNSNYPHSTYLTNLNNIAMFNNGTLHYNLTLPTMLNDNGLIEDVGKFIKDHSKAIKIIQWMEPFIISVYGSPDPFSSDEKNEDNTKFSALSQRCAISRYISIGTYNSNIMPLGKILTTDVNKMDLNKLDYWWFNKFYENNAYTRLEHIGMDINFNKHYNHGIEIRFLEHICDEKNIHESFEFIIYLMDYILESDHINSFENPIFNKIWNNITLQCIIHGHKYNLTNEEKELYENIFQIKFKKYNVLEMYYELYCNFKIKYNKIYKDENNLYTIIPRGKFSFYALSKLENKKTEINDEFENFNNCCNII